MGDSEFFLIDGDPAEVDGDVAFRLFEDGEGRAVTPSGLRSDGVKISEEDFNARVSARRASARAANMARKGGK